MFSLAFVVVTVHFHYCYTIYICSLKQAAASSWDIFLTTPKLLAENFLPFCYAACTGLSIYCVALRARCRARSAIKSLFVDLDTDAVLSIKRMALFKLHGITVVSISLYD